MGVVAAFCILRGKILLKALSEENEDWYSRLYISDDLRNITVDGWSIKLKGHHGKQHGKIICNHKFVYYGNIVNKKQVFDLENGTLVIAYPEMNTNLLYLDYDTFDLVQTTSFYPLAKYEASSSTTQEYEPNLNVLGPLFEKDELARKVAKQLYDQFDITL